jgi:hypothetical protein
MARIQEIYRLHQVGWSCQRIALDLSLHRKSAAGFLEVEKQRVTPAKAFTGSVPDETESDRVATGPQAEATWLVQLGLHLWQMTQVGISLRKPKPKKDLFKTEKQVWKPKMQRCGTENEPQFPSQTSLFLARTPLFRTYALVCGPRCVGLSSVVSVAYEFMQGG